MFFPVEEWFGALVLTVVVETPIAVALAANVASPGLGRPIYGPWPEMT